MWNLYDKLFPEGDDKSNRKWRTTVGNSILGLTMFAMFTVLAMVYDIPKLGSLAWGGEVDKKIATAVQPLETRMAKMETVVTETSDTTKILLAKLASDQIDSLVRRRCRASDPDEIAYLSKEIRRYQDDYEASRGKTYPTPTCEEVGYKEKIK